MNYHNFWLRPALLTLTLVLLAGCARIEPPPGGPVDTTGPSVVTNTPASSSTRVLKSNRVSIQFSEGVDRKSAEAAVFISPRPKGDLRFKWQGRIMNIILPDSFASNTTYVINIGPSVVDYRNNKLGKSFQIAFSTGDSISQGKIEGTIYRSAKPAPSVSVGLYDTILPPRPAEFDSLYPPFLTQSGATGDYSLDYLPDGTFLPVAFDDRNNNKRLDYPQEEYGMPDRLGRVPQNFVPHINFNLIRKDTAAVSILSAAVTADHLVKIRLSRPVQCARILNSMDKMHLASADSGGPLISPQAMLERATDTASALDFYFASLSNGNYRLKMNRYLLEETKDSSGYAESAKMTIKLEPDKVPPAVLSIFPAVKYSFPSDSVINIQFSEPIDRKTVTDSSIIVMGDDSTRFKTSLAWKDYFKTDLYIGGLGWGTSAKIIVNMTQIADLAGNRGDSTKVFPFKTYNSDSLGGVSGTVSYGAGFDTTGTIYLIFSSLAEKLSFTRIARKSFSYQLPPGRYILTGYLDRNSDSVQDLGSLFPMRLAETSGVYPDTVKIRSRFETAGIDFQFK